MGNFTQLIRKMEISIVSKEIIKPSPITTSNNHHRNPFKISLFDQLTPTTYFPLILFYDHPFKYNTLSSSTRCLKTSLSQTLARLYPLSGRLKNNYSIDDFEQGIPYIESRVSCPMSDFLQQPQMDTLNNFLPCRPFCRELDYDTMPQLAVQVNIFDCGGLAIGVSMSHKIFDGSTASFFLNTWAAAARGSNYINVDQGKHVLELSSSLYPPKDPFPQFYTQFWDSMWFGQRKLKTRRFVFDERAIATLRAEAKSEHVEYPTRTEALSGFIWKSAMSASRTLSDSSSPPRPSALSQVVDTRKRTRPRAPNPSIGNMFLFALATSRNEPIGLALLVQYLREAVAKIDSKYIKSFQGYDGLDVLDGYLKQLNKMFAHEKPELFSFTSWLKFGFDKINFGWGVPI